MSNDLVFVEVDEMDVCIASTTDGTMVSSGNRMGLVSLQDAARVHVDHVREMPRPAEGTPSFRNWVATLAERLLQAAA